MVLCLYHFNINYCHWICMAIPGEIYAVPMELEKYWFLFGR